MSHPKAQRRQRIDASNLCALATCRETIVQLICLALVWLATSLVYAADVKVETVLTGLHHPCGITLRPNATADKYELYIADSGAGRVVKWTNHDRGKIVDVITGFP